MKQWFHKKQRFRDKQRAKITAQRVSDRDDVEFCLRSCNKRAPGIPEEVVRLLKQYKSLLDYLIANPEI